MDVLILDEVKSRTTKLAQTLESRRHKVVRCITSNEFLGSVNSGLPGVILADVDTWQHGRSI